ncbi:aspartate-semialdehyde dehydrogenase [Helicobacter baculiformis]|uniref:Aspartate-semialdehyde dehydrogenase n=1 Tax=Helicobacter baculiformis TaxID=427351 RepID=A0ABV7ZI30_9HELI|nr:aspartate-semialdehyde dehydrogenase [Helicobacter baculiformis]
MKRYNVALVGASGAVGAQIIELLEKWNFPIERFVPLASKRSANTPLSAFGRTHYILETTHDIFAQEKVDIAFFSAGGKVSAEFAPSAARAGALVIDNTSFFRLEKDIPLVVPEVNADDLQVCPRNIIANPNCSTIQMVQVLHPLHQALEITRVDVSTYQAVSGAGNRGMSELQAQMQGDQTCNVFPYPIALNVIPQIDIFLPSGYTKEEMKMVQETHKIMHANFSISATCVRVPVLRSHSESLSVHFARPTSAQEVREILENASNVVVQDDPAQALYPMPIHASHTDQSFVGRIRSDLFDSSVVHLWCVADQLRVGAATNALKIALKYLKL